MYQSHTILILQSIYRAGYIESWGRGIQKIRDACKNLGADDPEYIVHGRVKVQLSAEVVNDMVIGKFTNSSLRWAGAITFDMKKEE